MNAEPEEEDKVFGVVGADTVRCPGCGQVIDVGYELQQHRREHGAERYEVEP